MKPVRIAALCALVLAAVAVALAVRPTGAHGSSGADASGGITVTGTGTATLVPDRASMSFGVTTQARSAAAALGADSTAMTKVIAALEQAGIAKADLQTSSVSVSPQTNDSGTTIVGYTASNTVTATVRDLGRLGGVIDAAVGAGANTVSGPDLTVADQGAAYRSALAAAVADARAKAQAIATAAGVTLGAITSVEESSASAPIPFAASAGKATDSTTVEPGTQQLTATVQVTFAS